MRPTTDFARQRLALFLAARLRARKSPAIEGRRACRDAHLMKHLETAGDPATPASPAFRENRQENE
jgi:hypothetical protein